jgi:hypothetical protein
MLSDSAVIDWDKRCWLYSSDTYAKKTLTGTQRDMGLAQRRLENRFLQTLVSTTLQWIKQ